MPNLADIKCDTDAGENYLDEFYFFPAPEPRMDESRVSWLQRICGEYQCSMKSLLEFFELSFSGRNLDLGINDAVWGRFSKLVGYTDSCGEATFASNQLKEIDFHGPSICTHEIFLSHNRLPATKWCVDCLSDDSVKYLRWHWRLSWRRFCSIHKRALSDRCPWCNSAFYIHRALLVGDNLRLPVTDLSMCGACGMSLIDEIEDKSRKIGLVSTTFNAILAEIQRAHQIRNHEFRTAVLRNLHPIARLIGRIVYYSTENPTKDITTALVELIEANDKFLGK